MTFTDGADTDATSFKVSDVSAVSFAGTVHSVTVGSSEVSVSATTVSGIVLTGKEGTALSDTDETNTIVIEASTVEATTANSETSVNVDGTDAFTVTEGTITATGTTSGNITVGKGGDTGAAANLTLGDNTLKVAEQKTATAKISGTSLVVTKGEIENAPTGTITLEVTGEDSVIVTDKATKSGTGYTPK